MTTESPGFRSRVMSVLLARFPSQTPETSGVPSANVGAGPVGAGGCFEYRPMPPCPEPGACPRPGACACSETPPATARTALKPMIHIFISPTASNLKFFHNRDPHDYAGLFNGAVPRGQQSAAH